MAKTKDEIVADLYALRGGLSVISGYTDEIRAKEEVIALNENEAKQKQMEINAYNEELKKSEGLRKAYVDRIKKIDKEISEEWAEKDENVTNLKYKMMDKKGLLKKGSLSVTFFRVASIILLVINLLLGMSILETMKSPRESFLAFLEDMKPICIGGLLLFIASIIGLLISKKLLIKGESERYRKEIEALERACCKYVGTKKKYLDDEQDCLKNCNANIRQIKEKIRVAEENLAEQKNKNVRIAEEKNGEITAVVAQSKMLENALKESYEGLILEADWGNIDLLIFYLETRRADDLKEALQLVDKQKQTDQITNAISAASQAIQSSVHSATMRLATALEASFTLIGKQLNEMSQKMERVAYSIEEGQRIQQVQASAINEIGGSIVRLQQEQLSVTELNKALLEKANQSSETLLNDLRYNQRLWIK
ncbi:MAG: hypothetical protein IKD47_05565 [Clostridia bacterium]|nr:hypothetical protein [Clostridia bacterium]